MARLALAVVEVTAPDGSKSLWVAYSVPHGQAIAAVKGTVPADHIAELSIRRAPPGLAFEGARPGDIIRIEFWPRCRSCSASLRLARELLDTRKGKTIRLFRCACGERIWD
jgi:hypothetical protein